MITKTYENAFKELLAYIASGSAISIEERRVLRRYSLASIRLLDGVVLNACEGSKKYSEPYFTEEYPIDEAVAGEIGREEEKLSPVKKDKGDLPW